MKKHIQIENINSLLYLHGDPEKTINHFQKSILDSVFRMVLHNDQMDKPTEEAIQDLHFISQFFENLKVGITVK